MTDPVVLVVVGAVAVVAWPARPVRARRLGAATPSVPRAGHRGRWVPLVLIAVAVVSPPLAVVAGVGFWARPRWQARAAAQRARWAVVDALPEAADLLALAVAGGATVPVAVAVTARWSPPPVGPAFARAAREIDQGRPTAEALEQVGERLGGPAAPLVAVLVASERYGVPLRDALDRLARDARLERRRRAEERARRVPVLLLFPLVTCVLPAFGLLTVVPLLVGSLPELPG